MGRVAVKIALSHDDRARLMVLVNDPHVAEAASRVASVVLHADEGLTNTEISHELRMSTVSVGRWRKEFARHGMDIFMGMAGGEKRVRWPQGMRPNKEQAEPEKKPTETIQDVDAEQADKEAEAFIEHLDAENDATLEPTPEDVDEYQKRAAMATESERLAQPAQADPELPDHVEGPQSPIEMFMAERKAE